MYSLYNFRVQGGYGFLLGVFEIWDDDEVFELGFQIEKDNPNLKVITCGRGDDVSVFVVAKESSLEFDPMDGSDFKMLSLEGLSHFDEILDDFRSAHDITVPNCFVFGGNRYE